MNGWDGRMAELRERFVQRTLGDRAVIAAGPRDGRDLLEAAVHRISGSAGMFGFQTLGEAAEALEQAIRDNRPEQEVAALAGLLASEIDGLQAR